MNFTKLAHTREKGGYASVLLEFDDAKTARKASEHIFDLDLGGKPIGEVIALYPVGKYLTFYVADRQTATDFLGFLRRVK